MTSDSLDELRSRLLARVPSSALFGFQGLRAADSITVESCLPLEFLVACDWGLDGPAWDARLRYFAVEKTLGRRIVWTHQSIVDAFAGAWGEALRNYLTEGDAPRFIIPYRSTEFLEQLSDDTDGLVTVIANPLHLKNRFDDKIAFHQEAVRRGLAVPPGEIRAVGELSSDLLQKWGPQLIITERVGSSGNQTHLIRDPQELVAVQTQLKEKSGEDALVIANRFLDGPALGMTALIFQGKPRISQPSVMVNGLKGCSMHRFDYAGSDYGAIARLPDSALEQVKKDTLIMGEWAADLGYQGIFGVDFIIHDGEPYALEFNPRLLGTTQLMTELELRQSSVPPAIYWHLAELMGVKISEEGASVYLDHLAASPLSGFQLWLRNIRPHPVRIGRSLPPGIYAMENKIPKFLREGDRISALNGPDEILVTCSPPAEGTEVEPRGAFFKLEGLGTILDDAARCVRPHTVQMVASFSELLNLSE